MNRPNSKTPLFIFAASILMVSCCSWNSGGGRHDDGERWGVVKEPATFWSAIATNTTYSEEMRRVSVFELFQRHIKPGMSLREVANILDRGSWISNTNIHQLKVISFPLPFDPNKENYIYSIDVFPTQSDDALGIYMALSDEVSVDDLATLFSGELASERVASVKIKKIGCVMCDLAFTWPDR